MYSVRSLSKTERKQEMIKKYSEEKRLEVINARKDGATIAQIAVMTGVGQTTVKAWLKDAGWQDQGGSKAGFNSLIIRKLSYNSRKIDFLSLFQKASTIVFLYGFFILPFAGKIKNGISAGPKVVSEIPYILHFFLFMQQRILFCSIKRSFSPK